MIEIGKHQNLTAIRRTPQGMYLGNDEHEVLLPNKYIPENLQPGDSLDVFVYLDSEERIVATTLDPKIHMNEFAVLEVKDVNKSGAFLDWGLEKDLMVPFTEQQKNMKPGEKYLVYMYLDEDSNRLAATSKIDRYLEKGSIDLEPGERVDLLIGESTDIGINVIINNKFKGLVYHNQVFKPVQPGEKTVGYIKEIRPDNKIDVALQPQGYQNIDTFSEEIIEKLKKNNGFLPLSDKSDPADISKTLGMSKKTFKKAIGALYKERLISIENDGIRLNQ